MIQVKIIDTYTEYEMNETLKELQKKGCSILDTMYNFDTCQGLVVYDTNDMIEDIKCEEGELKWDAKGNLGISGIKGDTGVLTGKKKAIFDKLSEEIDRYFR